MKKRFLVVVCLAFYSLLASCSSQPKSSNKKAQLATNSSVSNQAEKSSKIPLYFDGGYSDFLEIINKTNSPDYVKQTFVRQKDLFEQYSRQYCSWLDKSKNFTPKYQVQVALNAFGKSLGSSVFPPYFPILIANNSVNQYCPEYKKQFQEFVSKKSFNNLISNYGFEQVLPKNSQVNLYNQYVNHSIALKLPILSFEDYVSNGSKMCSIMETHGYDHFLNQFINQELPKVSKPIEKQTMVTSTSAMIQTFCLYRMPQFDASLPFIKEKIKTSIKQAIPKDFFKDGA